MATSITPGRPTVKKTTRFQENVVETIIHGVESIGLDEEPLFTDEVNGFADQYSVPETQIPVSDDKVKEVIRLLQCWKMYNVLDISPYSLELLAHHENRLRPIVPLVDQLFRRCMGKLTTCHHICIVFDTHYSSRRDTKTTMIAPFITNPSNPHENTLADTNIKAVSAAGAKYFKNFYTKYPTAPRGQSKVRGRNRSSKSRSRSRAHSRSRTRSRSRGGLQSLYMVLRGQDATATPSPTSKEPSDVKTAFGEDIDDVVRCLQNMSHWRYTVKEVIKAGSLGKGTALEDSDIDLVVYFNGLRDIETLKEARPNLLDLIKENVEKSDFQEEVKWKRGTPYAVKFSLRGIGVDILPAFDILEDAGSPAKVYKAMEDFPGGPHKASQEFSASLVMLQRNFVKKADSRVKDVIRMLKTWSDENNVRANSYSLELLTIYFGRVYGVSDEKELFRKCMEKLESCEHLQIAFDDYYDSMKYTRSMHAPYILDPANPYRDTLERVNKEKISRKAREYLHSH